MNSSGANLSAVTGHRQLVVLRGSPARTRRQAEELLSQVEPSQVAWVDGSGRELLGQSFEAVVVDFHPGLDANRLGCCHGLVWGGGALILRLNPVLPGNFGARFERFLSRFPHLGPDASRRIPLNRRAAGSSEQAAVVQALKGYFRGPPAVILLTAPRGRGKSAALGLALRGREAKVTAHQPKAAEEIFRFAGEGAVFVPVAELLSGASADLIVVDEAARLGVPALKRLVALHPHSTLALSTTVAGYEGSGRGFLLRLLEWLRWQPREVHRLTLEQPIRWDAGDPLEEFIFQSLILDAELSQPFRSPEEPAHIRFEQRALAQDEERLREFFGLLVQAHYCTTPRDLQQLLESPDMDLHGLLQEGRLVAVSLVAREDPISVEQGHKVWRGESALRGRAVMENLIKHLGLRAAHRLRIVRSVRIAVHPDFRRRGFGSLLVEAVHRCYRPDLFATLFGATAELLEFRQGLGYQAVRLSASRGSRSGEPAVLMLRPVSAAGTEVYRELRRDFEFQWPVQRALLTADGILGVDDQLAEVVEAGMVGTSSRVPPGAEELRAQLLAFVHGPRNLESVAATLSHFLATANLSGLEPLDGKLLRERFQRHRSWVALAHEFGVPVRVAMRRCRKALCRLVGVSTSER